jgi:hypothetical protein
MRKLLLALAAVSTLALVGVATPSVAVAKPHTRSAHSHAQKNKDPVIYDSTVGPSPGDLNSTAFEATSTSEFGDQITFGGSARVLDNVVVQMASWGCQSGNWFGTLGLVPPAAGQTPPCSSAPGATFNEPITLNIYSVGADNSVGGLLASDTQTFAIPYMPSADPNFATDCAADATLYDLPINDFAGTWYDANPDQVTGQPIGCLYGILANVTFDFGHVTLPNNVIYGIAYNTSDYGSQPYGDNTACHSTQQGCPYDSLNVGDSLSPGEPSVGTDPNLGTAYLDSSYAGFYCDDGFGGVGVFRLDGRADTNNCYNGGGDDVGYSYSATDPGVPTDPSPYDLSPYLIPAVQFNAVPSPAAVITSANNAAAVAGTPFAFTITTTGVPTPSITARGKIPHGLSFLNLGNGTAAIFGSALTTDRNGIYKITLRAMNLPTGGRNRQTFTLTLTGGRP